MKMMEHRVQVKYHLCYVILTTGQVILPPTREDNIIPLSNREDSRVTQEGEHYSSSLSPLTSLLVISPHHETSFCFVSYHETESFGPVFLSRMDLQLNYFRFFWKSSCFGTQQELKYLLSKCNLLLPVQLTVTSAFQFNPSTPIQYHSSNFGKSKKSTQHISKPDPLLFLQTGQNKILPSTPRDPDFLYSSYQFSWGNQPAFNSQVFTPCQHETGIQPRFLLASV